MTRTRASVTLLQSLALPSAPKLGRLTLGTDDGLAPAPGMVETVLAILTLQTGPQHPKVGPKSTVPSDPWSHPHQLLLSPSARGGGSPSVLGQMLSHYRPHLGDHYWLPALLGSVSSSGQLPEIRGGVACAGGDAQNGYGLVSTQPQPSPS